jgi:hypothetical protein
MSFLSSIGQVLAATGMAAASFLGFSSGDNGMRHNDDMLHNASSTLQGEHHATSTPHGRHFIVRTMMERHASSTGAFLRAADDNGPATSSPQLRDHMGTSTKDWMLAHDPRMGSSTRPHMASGTPQMNDGTSTDHMGPPPHHTENTTSTSGDTADSNKDRGVAGFIRSFFGNK